MVSSWAPPMAGGAAVVLRELLADFPPDSYAVLTDRLAAFTVLGADEWLPTRHYFLDSEGPLSPLEASAAVAVVPPRATHAHLGDVVTRGLRRASRAVRTIRTVRQVTLRTMQVIEAEDPDLLLATSGDPAFLVAAADAADATGRSLDVHLFDLFARNRYSIPKRILASRAERRILQGARHVFVPNQAMLSYYRDRLGIAPIVVSNGTTIPPFRAARPASTSPTILYTGAVYWAQRDAVLNLTRAIRELPGVNLEVKTSAAPRALVRVGLRLGEGGMRFGNRTDSLEAQRDADLLFLPLAFRTSAPDVIQTAFPAKTAEYLVSGTPILVHAPPDAYISQYARAAQWGYVVDKANPHELANAIRRLLSDNQLRADLVERAYGEAVRSHDMRKIRREYATYFA